MSAARGGGPGGPSAGGARGAGDGGAGAPEPAGHLSRGLRARAARGWRAWVALWDRREDATGLALVRIAVAAVLLYDFLIVWRLDLIDALWAVPPAGYAAPYDGWAGPGAGGALWLGAVASLTAILVGLATPVACAAFVLISAQLGHLAPDADRGIDMMLRLAIGILALSRCGARWSLDALALRRLGRPPPREVPAWPRYLLMAQLVWIYFSGGTNKAGAEWGPHGGFAALSNILADPHFARFDPSWLAIGDPLARVATAVTIAFELSAPAYLWLYRARARRIAGRLRWAWLAIGAAFHLGIALAMTMGIFAWGMLALYPALLAPEELRALGARLTGWARRGAR